MDDTNNKPDTSKPKTELWTLGSLYLPTEPRYLWRSAYDPNFEDCVVPADKKNGGQL